MVAPYPIALLHDMYHIRGGGERLSLVLARELAQTLCYAYEHPDSFSPAAECPGLERIALLPPPTDGSRPHNLRVIRAFRTRTNLLRHFRTVVYSGIFSPLAVHNTCGARNFFYCHTPPRFVYDQREALLQQLPFAARLLRRLFLPRFQRHYEAAVERMDLVIANSETVRKRIRTFLGRDALVVHPPCDTERFTWLGSGDYFLSTARLEPLKRVRDIVQAFLGLPDQQLVVASGGAESEALRRLAANAPNIRFTGWLDDAALFQLVGNCRATLYLARDEDFGMSPVESMAAGKPVIGVAEGGLTETVLPGHTGLLLPRDYELMDIRAAVRSLDANRAQAMRRTCEERARLFSTERFLKAMREIVLS